MKIKVDIDLNGRCESHFCSSVESGRCTRNGMLYAVWDNVCISKEFAHWYYYCDEAVEIDKSNNFFVEKIE